MPLTKGFRSPTELANHFAKHRNEFNFSTSAEYGDAADALLGGPVSATILHAVRPSGDVMRYDLVFDRFAVMSHDGYIRTMYRPQLTGGETRRDYFQRQSGRM